MTKTLQILYISILGLIILFWLVDISFFSVNDARYIANTMETKVDYDSAYWNELLLSWLHSLYYAAPTFILILYTIKSYRHNDEILFFWTFLIGLSLFQIIVVNGLIINSYTESTFIILAIMFTTFLTGQITSIYKLIKKLS